jgi:phage FluMu protein Com
MTMIRIDLIQFISLIITFALVLVFVLWMTYNYREGDELLERTDDLVQCPFCTFVFFQYKKGAEVSICPRCKSYMNTYEKTDENTYPKAQ